MLEQHLKALTSNTLPLGSLLRSPVLVSVRKRNDHVVDVLNMSGSITLGGKMSYCWGIEFISLIDARAFAAIGPVCHLSASFFGADGLTEPVGLK